MNFPLFFIKAKEEEEERKAIEEAERLAAEARRAEEERLQKAIEEVQKREEEERKKKVSVFTEKHISQFFFQNKISPKISFTISTIHHIHHCVSRCFENKGNNYCDNKNAICLFKKMVHKSISGHTKAEMSGQ